MSGGPIPAGLSATTAPILRVACAAALAGLLAVLAACANIPTERFYTLSAVAPERAGRAANSFPDVAIVVDPATVPELIDRPQFVVSIGESRISILEQQRWAEPLKTQISRTVAMNLARLLGAARASSTAPLSGRSDADYRVTLDVQRFEARPGDAVAIDVLWTVRRGAAAAPTPGRSAVREKVGTEGYDALVAAHSRALATISGEIAAAIR